MTSKQLESRVRRIVQDAGKRKIWHKASQVARKLAKEFGTEKMEVQSDHINTDRSIWICTGTGWVVVRMWSCHWGPMNVEVFLGHDLVFNAHSAAKCDYLAAKAKGEEWRYVKDGRYSYAVIKSYKPGNWERVLELHEARRLLMAVRDVKVSAAEKEKKKVEDDRPLTDADKQIAAKFGIKV